MNSTATVINSTKIIDAEHLSTTANNNNNNINNIYETVPDQSVILSSTTIVPNNTTTTTSLRNHQQKINSKKQALKQMNITTNTIQSIAVAPFNRTQINNTTQNQTVQPSSSGGGGGRSSRSVKRFRPEQIELKSLIMQGSFGLIYEAELKLDDQSKNDESQCTLLNENAGNQRIKVLVKTVKKSGGEVSREQVELMVRESCMLKGLKHKNINPILGLIESGLDEDNDNNASIQKMSLFAYCELGNLKKYLLNIREESSFDPDRMITNQEILYLVLQLLKACNYMHSKNLIHKDIAARNCWLGENFQLKLSDYSLARDMFPADYPVHSKPVYWMAYESLIDNVYNAQTDIWSIGVCIWECFSLCEQPYEKLSLDPEEYDRFLIQDEVKNRLNKPELCSSDLFDFVRKCWSIDTAQRPTLKEMFNNFHKSYNNLNNYV
jgi:serine/threonine protein kinase